MLAFDALAVAGVGAARKQVLPHDMAASEIYCRAARKTFKVILDGYLTAFDTGVFPDEIELEVRPFFVTPLSRPIAGIGTVSDRIKCGAFALLVDRVKDWLTPINSAFDKWPAATNFCRVVRNGIVHNRINLNSPKSVAAEWCGVRIGRSRNGQPIFDERLSVADLIPLLLDLEAD